MKSIMLKLSLRVAIGWALITGLLPGSALGQPIRPAVPVLAGVWKGPLAIPGGSVPIQIVISQPAPNKLIANLDLPAKRLTRLPMSLTFRGDTLVFYAALAESRFVCVASAEGQQLRGVWSQPGLRVPLTLSLAAEGTVAALASSRLAPVATTYHTEQVTLTSQPGNVALAGTLSIPDGAGPFPSMLLLSDMGSHDRDARVGDYRLFGAMAAAFARQGIAVLRLDDRGVGQSGGNGRLATTADLLRDALAGLNYLRLRPSIDPVRTGLLGHGEGGNVALLAAAQPVPPGFVVTLAAAGLPGLELLANQAEPPLSPTDTAQAGAARRGAWAEVQQKAAKLRASGSNAAQVETYLTQQHLKIKSEERKHLAATVKFRRAMLEIISQTANNDQAQAIVVNMLRQRYPNQAPAEARSRAAELITPWSRYYLKFDPQPGLADVQCPVLLLNGAEDAEVNAIANLTALEKGLRNNKQVSARRLAGVNHWFQTPAAELIPNPDGTVDPIISTLMLDTVRDWVQQQGGK
ncbi:alpha/beta hydrolase [Hymenobacter sp. BT683]|uniref:Alpha/beta hydrolase n=1 Tax=Hymenobacter jeongseonensis TaxID=2791027 RepID=A0ABS0IM24_9BACT|nr:alpha/beta hydrolase [Hymenobacter jeongseonensis]MBF9239391.1 alpha/beta hydrolase [Hymenobacter jeongseonensis]